MPTNKSWIYLLIGVIISPYVSLLIKLCAVLGLCAILNLTFGYFYFRTKKITRFQSPILSYSLKQSATTLVSHPDTTHAVIFNLLLQLFHQRIGKYIITSFERATKKYSLKQSQFSTSFNQLIESKLSLFVTHFVSFIRDRDGRRFPISQRLWCQVFTTLQKHIELVKKIRTDIIRDQALMNPESPSHLDDFNDVSIDSLNASNPEYQVNNQDIVSRLQLMSLLHPALLNKSELEYSRLFVSNIVDNIDSCPFTSWISSPSKLVKLASIEIIVANIIQPFIKEVSNPEFIDRLLLEKTLKLHALQQSVKSFRETVASHFLIFPPRLVQSYLTPQSDPISRLRQYSKRCFSVADCYSIILLIKNEIYTTLSDDSRDKNEKTRYINQMTVLRDKFDRKMNSLIGNDIKIRKQSLTTDHKQTNPIIFEQIIEEYIKSQDSQGQVSLKLHHFMDFLQSGSNLWKLRLFHQLETFRMLQERLSSNSFVGESAGIVHDSQDDLNHDRLTNEARKIYNAFFTSSLVKNWFELNCPDTLLNLNADALNNFLGDSNFLGDLLAARFDILSHLKFNLFEKFQSSGEYFLLCSELQKQKIEQGNHNIDLSSLSWYFYIIKVGIIQVWEVYFCMGVILYRSRRRFR